MVDDTRDAGARYILIQQQTARVRAAMLLRGTERAA